MESKPIHLIYEEPVLRNRHIIYERCEKKLSATSLKEARTEADAFLKGGVIIFGGETHLRKEMGFGRFIPGTEKIREEFFSSPDKLIPYEQLTPLQKRMQSGGA